MQRLTWWRVAPQWFAVAVLVIPLSEVVVAVALSAVPDALRALTPAALLLYPAAYLSHFFFGPLFEESGWRGSRSPACGISSGPVRGSLLLGLLWMGWHLLCTGRHGFEYGIMGGGAAGAGFFVTGTALSFIFTWLSNNTKAGLLLAILLHGSVDGTATYMQVLVPCGEGRDLQAAGFQQHSTRPADRLCRIGMLLTVVETGGSLSYQRYPDEAEQLDLDRRTVQQPAPRVRDYGS